jgi:hypothetical protein
MAHSPANSSSSSASDVSAAFLDDPQAASLAVVQTVNIRNHVPINLDLLDSNYSQWRCLFDSVLGKFGLVSHIRAPPLINERDAEWRQVDCCLTNWIYNTVTKGVFDLIYKPKASAFTIWSDIEGLFCDNEMHRAVLLEAEFRSIVQGDLSVTDYCTKLKKLADNLRDVGHPVSEPSQVLNLIRGLNKKFRHVKPVLTSKSYTFMSARSYLLLEELQLEQEDKNEAGQAFLAGHGVSATTGVSANPGGSPGSGSAPSGNSTTTGADSGANRGFKNKNKRRGRGGAPFSSGGGTSSGGAPRPSAPWAANYNPWTGLVQAWPMPFQAPGSGVLGPRPPFPAQQAMLAHHQPPPTPASSSTSGASAWDNSALYAALNNAGVATHPPSSADWYFDTGASAHMSSSGIISTPQSLPSPSFVIVGNGARLPVTHTAAAHIPTSSSPLHLHNVLVTPSLIKNLISVKNLTRDNNVSIEFDPYGFSVKDLATRTVILRSESSGDLYPLRLPQHHALTASSSSSVELWHNRLGHPGSAPLRQIMNSFDFQCNKTTTHSCHHCQLGKHVRLPFHSSQTPIYFPFQLVHSDVWTSPVHSHTGYKYYVVLIDAYTHYIWTFPIRNKSDVQHIIRSFFSYVHTQFRLPIEASPHPR